MVVTFITRQQFITQTLTFIANSVFINIFAKVFGMSNSIVAVSIVVIALSMVAIDLKQHLFKKTFYLSVVLLILGTSATLIHIHPLLGLMINLVVVFFIAYEGCNTYKENIYFPFLLGYIFMALSAPAKTSDLPLRLVAIFVGCLYILLIQLVFNKDRFHKTLVHQKKQLLARTMGHIDCMLTHPNQTKDVKSIYPLTRAITKAIYDTRVQGSALSDVNKGNVLFVIGMENLYKALDTLAQTSSLTEEKDAFLLEIKAFLVQLEAYFYSKKDTKPTAEALLAHLDELKHFSKEQAFKPVLASLHSIEESLPFFEKESEETMPKKFAIKSFIKPIDPQSVPFKFAAKLALSVSIVMFLTDVCNLTYGRWIIFPLIAIVQPYMDGTLKKAFERVTGTLIGIVLFVVIFSLVQDNMVRLNITIFLAYINLFVRKYAISTSLVAVSALGSVAMGGAGVEILSLRIFFTILGCVLGLLINKYFFPHTIHKYTDELMREHKTYKDTLKATSPHALDSNEHYTVILKSKLLEYKINELLFR